MEFLEVWVIYDHPTDNPNCYIARKFLNNEPTLETIKFQDLHSIRKQLRDRGLTPIKRDESDPLPVVECWQ